MRNNGLIKILGLSNLKWFIIPTPYLGNYMDNLQVNINQSLIIERL